MYICIYVYTRHAPRFSFVFCLWFLNEFLQVQVVIQLPAFPEGGTLRTPTPFGRVLTKSSLNKS